MAQVLDILNRSNLNPSPNKGFMMSFKEAPASQGGVGNKVTIAPGETRRVTFPGAVPQKVIDLESASDITTTLVENIDNFSAAKISALTQKLDGDAGVTDVDYESVVDATL